MGDNLVVCDIDEDVITKINKLRFRKETTNAALVMKVEKQRKTVVLDEEFEDISVEDLKDELPERQPSNASRWDAQFNVHPRNGTHIDASPCHHLSAILPAQRSIRIEKHGGVHRIMAEGKARILPLKY
uniref:Glia maturation factor beta n=1 Tax=Eptatretus burgeri TaxID=7764 RepID=A0A8C4Q6T6_EPTBU